MAIKRVLIVRFRRVGDAVLTTALCNSLKQSFPGVQIDLILNTGIDQLFQGHPSIDNVITFSPRENHSIFPYIARVWRLVRQGRYDVIIDMRSTFRTLWFALFSRSSAYRIGLRKPYNLGLYNHVIDLEQNASDLSALDRWLKMLEPLAAEAELSLTREFNLHVTDDEKARMREKMQAAGIDFSRPVMLVAVATRLPHKMWPLESMGELLGLLIEKYQVQIVFNYAGQVEESRARELYQRMQLNSHIFIDIRADSLRELAALLANCQFFFGNEGGPRHMAQSLGVPAFAIYPPGISKGLWMPKAGDAYQGIEVDDLLSREQLSTMSYQEKFDALSVEQVWSRLEPMLDNYLVSTSAESGKLVHH